MNVAASPMVPHDAKSLPGRPKEQFRTRVVELETKQQA
jgi:hypothetical protein